MFDLMWVCIFAIIGALFGALTGLVPGLHVNNLALMLLSISSLVLLAIEFITGNTGTTEFHLVLLCVIIISTSLAHTFVNFIPAAFLGAPEAETALNVLPAHAMLLEGRGYQATVLSAIGSFGAVVFSLALLVPFRFVIGNPVNFYRVLQDLMVFILIGISVLLIYTEHRELPYKRTVVNGNEVKRVYGTYSRTCGVMLATALFIISGIFGIIVLEQVTTSPLGLPSTPLFPAFCGLFGVATLLYSLLSKPAIPEQQIEAPIVDKPDTFKSVVTGSTAGAFIGFLPGVTCAHATVLAMLARSTRGGSKNEQVVLTLSAVNTAYAFFALVTLFLILRARTGATLVVKQLIPIHEWSGILMPTTLIYLLIAVIITAVVSFFMTCILGKWFARVFNKVPYRPLVIAIIIFLIVMVFLFTDLFGLLILAVGTAIGLIAPAFGIRRSHAMGVLLLPIILMLWGTV
jgi:putative membrane protein